MRQQTHTVEYAWYFFLQQYRAFFSLSIRVLLPLGRTPGFFVPEQYKRRPYENLDRLKHSL